MYFYEQIFFEPKTQIDVLIWWHFVIFQFSLIQAYLSVGNLIAHVAALILASKRSRLKTTGFIKMYGISFFNATLWKVFAFFAEILISLSNYCTDFHKKGNNRQTGCFFMCLHILIVYFHKTPRSTAFESFRRLLFDLF